jgi:hypothetical protein
MDENDAANRLGVAEIFESAVYRFLSFSGVVGRK